MTQKRLYGVSVSSGIENSISLNSSGLVVVVDVVVVVVVEVVEEVDVVFSTNVVLGSGTVVEVVEVDVVVV